MKFFETLTSNTKTKNSTSIAALTPKEKIKIAFTNLFKMVGLSRKGNFYRCEYDLQDIQAAIDTDSYLNVVIKKYTELMFKAGYSFKSSNDAAIEYLEKRFRIMSYQCDQPIDLVWRGIVADLIAFSNAFLIKTRVDQIPFVSARGIVNSLKPVGGYYRADPSTMQIEYNDDGSIKSYKQTTASMKEKIFSVDDVIHMTFDRKPGSDWGTPRWIAALEDIKILRKIEGDVVSIIYRFAQPLYHVIVGNDTSGQGGTEKEVLDAKNDFESAPPDGMVVTTERTHIEVVGSEGKALDLSNFLSYFEKRTFSALNSSEAMMGRGGAKQDADSMEEQIHNAVKDNQSVFAIQFEHNIINEILLEGGFNPILDENDIVTMDFNEINLDTKVKMENHEVNKFQSNAQTFDELRQHLGLRKDSVDEQQLYANMIDQHNALEQIDVNHQNALEIAQMQGEQNEKLARISASTKTGSSSSSSSSSSHKVTSSKNRIKKNTGNGKTTASKNGSKATVKANDSPSNQHGTYSAKIKENLQENIDPQNFILELRHSFSKITEQIKKSGSADLPKIKADIDSLIGYRISDSSIKAQKKAFEDLGIKPVNMILPCESDIVKSYSKKTLDNLFNDINKIIGNSTNRTDTLKGIDTIQYRLDYLGDFVDKKSYWYSYAKTCAMNKIQNLEILCNEGSSHSENHEHQLIDTNNFSINDIPGFSANCRCYMVPIKPGEGEDT